MHKVLPFCGHSPGLGQMKPGIRYRVLILDENQEECKRVRSVLEPWFDVKVFNDPSNALAFLEHTFVELILVDPDAGGGKGVEFVRSARSLWPFTTVMFYSEKPDPAAVLIAINEFGAHRFLVKPVDLDGLPDLFGEAVEMTKLRRKLTSAQLRLELSKLENEATGEALRESQDRLLMAQIIARMGSWEYKCASGTLHLSPGELMLLGMDESDRRVFCLEDFTTMIHPDDRQWIDWLIRHPELIRMDEFEFRILLGDNSYRYIRSQIKVIRDGNGAVTSIVGTDRDISEQKESELRNTVINDISRKLNSNLNLQEFCEYIYEQLLRVGEYPSLLVNTFDPKKERWNVSMRIERGRVQAEPNPSQGLDLFLGEHIMRLGRGLTLHADGINRLAGKSVHNLGEQAIPESWIGVPLISESSVVGVLASSSFKADRIFTERDLSLLSFIGLQIGSLIERLRAEEEIRQFERYFAVSMDLLCILDVRGNFSRVNQRFCEFSGCSEKQLLASSIFDFIHPEDESIARMAWEELRDSGMSDGFVNRFLCSDGTYKWLMWSASYEQDTKRIFAAARDITDQTRSHDTIALVVDAQSNYIGSKQVQDSLQKMMCRLLEVNDCEFGFITEKAESGDMIVHAACSRVNLEESGDTEELQKHEIELLFDRVMNAGELLIENNADLLGGERLKNFLGVPFYWNSELIGIVGLVNKNGNFLPEEAERLKPLLVTCQSIMNANRAEILNQEVKKELRRIAHIVSHSSDAIVSVDPEGKIQSWNMGASQMLGYQDSEMIGTDFIQLFPPAHQEKLKRQMSKALKGIQLESYDAVQIRQNGEQIHVNMSLFPLSDDNGFITGISGILRDISAQKQAVEMKEAYLKQLEVMVEERTKELHEANAELADSLEREKELGRMKSGFVSIASHQFRTPLAVIQASLGVLEMQKAEMSENLRARFERVFLRVREHIERMTNLMDEVLVLGKVSSGSIQPVFAPTNLVIMCQNLINSYAQIQTDGRRMDMKVQGAEKLLELDEKLMEQAISNLISNAFKYSEGARDPNMLIRFDKGQVELSVIDHGIGIPKKELEQIFEPFYRASNALDKSGTGLGSAIAKEYVELNKGRLEVKSHLNRGTEFKIILPQTQ